MPVITKSDNHWNSIDDYLIDVSPDILWFDIQQCGSYQGTVYGVGRYNQHILLYEGYYGSCSGCGAWGEGGEPGSQEEVINSSILFTTKEEAFEYINKEWDEIYDRPDFDRLNSAIEEVANWKR